MLGAVIFDMDGVIIDSEPLYFEIDKKVFRKYGIEVDDTFLNRYVGVSNPDMWKDVLRYYDLGAGIDEIMEVQAGLKDIVFAEADMTAITGINELLMDIKKNGVKTAIASSSSRSLIMYVLERLGIVSCFDVITSGQEMERGKPFPDIFLKTAELLCVKPNECVVIEDSNHGIKAATSAGMVSIGYINLNSGVQDLSQATCIVDDLRLVDYNKIFGLVK
jgi:haloacid dehalogenase superfamily, subfamily IA, variant 3 with third motif having DD or ED/haloacid dehalogenase superfamily, subfamily IA, variant 1 with third motif having Dx(3-4)D or Dx(3-4)E